MELVVKKYSANGCFLRGNFKKIGKCFVAELRTSLYSAGSPAF